MAMSDCIKCWSTPCECGHEGYDIIRYNADEKTLLEMIKKLENRLQILRINKQKDKRTIEYEISHTL